VQFVQFEREGACHDDLVTLRAPPRILVVDDDAGVRHALYRYLHRQGYAVAVAADGREGLTQLARADFDAVITDIRMPSMDGAEFWRQAVVAHPHLSDRFLFCSSLPVPSAVPPEHAARFLQKPFALADLLEALSDLLGEPRPTAPEQTD
jgi:CheY-like chemotaxis protein